MKGQYRHDGPVQIYFNHNWFSFRGDEERKKLEEEILYSANHFFPEFEALENADNADGRLIEIGFYRTNEGCFCRPGYGSDHERIFLPILILGSRASKACASYHEFYHSDQFIKGRFPPFLGEKSPSGQAILAELEVEDYSKTIEYASGLDRSLWKNELEKAEFIKDLKENLKEFELQATLHNWLSQSRSGLP